MKKLLLILLCLPMIGFGQCISGDCVNGFGTYKYPEAKYVGEFANGMFNGQGTMIWRKGQYKGHEYVGEFANGMFNGQGTYTFGKGQYKGSKYVGEFVNDKKNGQGTYTWPSGEKYVGEWKEDMRHGHGTNTWAQGNYLGEYVGEFKEDMRHGQGTHTFANGTVEKGLWKDDKLIESRDLEYFIKKFVEKKINEWQKKGEFEKTTEYLVRVNEKNRTVKIKEFQEAAIESLKLDFLKSIDFSNIELGDYDADNETFLLKDSKLGNLVISVPISEAKELKENFSFYNFLNPECEIIDNELRLSYVELTIENRKWSSYYSVNGKEKRAGEGELKTYTYSLANTQDYAITEIDYEFSSIEIDDIASVNKTKSSNISTNKLKVGSSSVNINIPTNSKVKNRFALIIGNEDYTSFQRTLSSEQDVDYAVNDATIFKKYCLNTLGVKEDNMFFITNATAGTMYRQIDLITKILNKVGTKAELIVYYAGHGYPDELTKVPYLIPVDVSAANLSTAIKLDDLYKKLANTNASKITIFLDACFTGGGRNSGLVASRGVKVKPKEGTLSGNIVVFSASSAEQSSLPYHDEGHGIFTYFLLKKFQETKGKVSLGELSEYLNENVSIKSLRVNQKEQDPTVNTSSKVQNSWRNWKF